MLVKAYDKGASPGTVLLDDEVASSSAPSPKASSESSYEHHGEGRWWGGGHGEKRVLRQQKGENRYEARPRFIGGEFRLKRRPRSRLPGQHKMYD